MKTLLLKNAVRAHSIKERIRESLQFKRKEGQSIIEWILIVALIAIVVIGALTLVGGKIGNKLNTIKNTLS